MRLIMYIMVAVNLMAFAWFNYQESFPESEKRVIHAIPEGVNKLRLLSEREPIKDVSVHTRNQKISANICHTIGPLKDHDLARDVLAEIKGLGREGNIRTEKNKVEYAYWVYLESMPNDELEKIIVELEANGIKDHYQNDRNELSLGIYNGIHGAERRQMRIAALGYSPLVGPLYRTETQYWVDVADMNYRFHTDDAWENYLARYPDSQRKSTRCDLINA